jgi:uncharacterized protein VirK/YbjX
MQPLRTADLFRRTDHGRGGWLPTATRRLAFEWHARLHHHSLRQVAHALTHPALSHLRGSDPQLLLRPLREYLWAGLTPRGRAQAFVGHYAWLLDALTDSALGALYEQRALQVLEHSLDASRLGFTLAPAHGPRRDGELDLQLRLDGAVLLRASLCVVPTRLLDAAAHTLGERALVIGSLHAEHGAAAGLQTLARLTHSSRPRALLLAVLQGLCAGWRLGAPLGVSSRAQLQRHQRQGAQRFDTDYDELWLELGAKRRLREHWLLPAAPEARHDAQVPAHRRTAQQRACELRQALFGRGTRWASAVSTP